MMNDLKRLRAMLVGFAGLFRRKQRETEMNAELRAHLDGLTERNIAAGMSPDEARDAALREFGGVEQIKERARDERRSQWGEHLLQDLRYAARQLRKTPAFTLVVVLSLALGIGGSTAVFGVLNEVLFKPLPVRNPHELIQLEWRHGVRGMALAGEHWSGETLWDASSKQPIGSTAFTLPAFESLRQDAASIADLVGVGGLGGGGYFSIDGAAEEGNWLLVSGNYHAMLGVDAVIGRTLQKTDERTDAEPVTVLSHAYWQRRFNADPAVLGKSVLIHNLSVTIVGVTEPRFFGTELGWSADFTLPLSTLGKLQAGIPTQIHRRSAEIEWLQILARLKPGVSRDQAASELEPAFHRAVRERAALRSLPSDSIAQEDLPRLAARAGAQGFSGIRQVSTSALFTLTALVGAVLIIACLNVANLLLARAAARQREIAVRLAMGASRGRIVRQLLTESGLLAALGAALSVFVAAWGQEALLLMRPLAGEIPMPTIDGHALLVTFGLAAATTLLFGLAPALHAARGDLIEDFKGTTAGLHGRSRGTLRLGRGLMVAQVALSLVVLIGAALFLQTLHNLRTAEMGFNRDNLVMFGLRAKPRRYAIRALTQVVQRIDERLASVPGVRAATFSRLPIGGLNVNPIFVRGATGDGKQKLEAAHNAVAPSYFTTLEIPLLLGRRFTSRDDESSPKVAIVNQALARVLFGDENPIGRRFGWEQDLKQDATLELEIVGMVHDAQLAAPREPSRPMFYVPFLQRGNSWVNFSVRTDGDPAASLSAVRQAVRDIDPEMVIVNLRTNETHLDQFVGRERMFARISSAFGLLVLALVCIGLYGLISYSVLRRTGEIGLRMALGALPRGVWWMILRESLALVAVGIVMGVAGAWAVARVIRSQLYGLSPTDPASYGAMALLLASVALSACTFPARRAAKTDPMVALRSE